MKGSDIRALDNELRNQGLKREVFRAVQRGDSPTAINKIFKQAGYHLDRFSTANYITQTYKPNTSLAYLDKVAQRYGHRSRITSAEMVGSGWQNSIKATVEFRNASGRVEYRTFEFDHAQYDSLSEVLDDVVDDIEKIDSAPTQELPDYRIVNFSFK